MLLAIKTAVLGYEPAETVVFDEIDAGVGGMTATAVGAKLKEISANSQVVVVTHLAQVAAYADRHYVIRKEADAERTVTRLESLDAERDRGGTLPDDGRDAGRPGGGGACALAEGQGGGGPDRLGEARDPAFRLFLIRLRPARKGSMAKHVFVTGGVVSSLGKGITAASLGRLLKSRGLKVVIQKFDPYLNVDPGTMSPFQHGEVFVTDDGAETDLDLGHYERFVDENLTRDSNITSGSVYYNVIRKERGATTWAAPCR